MPKPNKKEILQIKRAFPFLAADGTTATFSCPIHWHDCFELVFFIKGGAFASINGQVYKAAAGDIVMINGGIPHGFMDPNSGTMARILQFDLSFFDDSFLDMRDTVFNEALIKKNELFLTAEGKNIYLRLTELLDKAVTEFYKKRYGFQLAVKKYIYEFALVILRELKEKSPKIKTLSLKNGAVKKNINRHLRETLSFIFSNFDNSEITLETAAKKIALSKFHFTRFCKKYMGQSFHNYLTMTRVNFAKHFLLESDISVTDIAFRCGFGSLQTFNRVFKTYAGTTPSLYRTESKLRSSVI